MNTYRIMIALDDHRETIKLRNVTADRKRKCVIKTDETTPRSGEKSDVAFKPDSQRTRVDWLTFLRVVDVQ